MELTQQVQEMIERHALLPRGELVLLGLSGGPDSLCLLHVLRCLAPAYGITLHAAHLHHGLRGEEADADARFVAAQCAAWGIPCTVERVDVAALAQERHLAIEEEARQARYAFLGRLARAQGARTIAVAHHADDQVETVLMHFLRGAGLAGLRGMRPLSWLDELRLGDEPSSPSAERLRLVRPLLGVRRAEVEAYCRAEGLTPRYDESNDDQTYFRNRLRHALLPLLEEYNPNLRAVVWRTAEVLAADYERLRAQEEETWPGVVRRETSAEIVYDLAALRAQPLGLQRALLREGVQRLRRSLRNIAWVHIEDAVTVLRKGRTGAQAALPQGLLLTLGTAEARLAAAGEAWVGPKRPRLTQELVPLAVPGETPFPGGAWVLRARLLSRPELGEDWATNADPTLAYLDTARLAAPLALRPRRAGDWFCPLGLGGRQKLGDFFTNVKLPPAERATVPLLTCGDDIAWVVGWRVDARYALTPHTEQVVEFQCCALERED
jgi:tRNA(Ile)-lysidine synthase